MKEELVSFETAKLLKEKGFVNLSDKSYITSEGARYGLLSNFTNKCNNSVEEDRIEAPTQSLVQKWLRKKHNIDISIIPNYAHYKNGGLTGQKTYRLGIYYTENGLIDCFFIRPPDDKDLFIEYNIYEEALEEGLKEGLNLIQ